MKTKEEAGRRGASARRVWGRSIISIDLGLVENDGEAKGKEHSGSWIRRDVYYLRRVLEKCELAK